MEIIAPSNSHSILRAAALRVGLLNDQSSLIENLQATQSAWIPNLRKLGASLRI